MSILPSFVHLLVVTNIQVHLLQNFWGSLGLKCFILQIAVNVKIIKNR